MKRRRIVMVRYRRISVMADRGTQKDVVSEMPKLHHESRAPAEGSLKHTSPRPDEVVPIKSIAAELEELLFPTEGDIG